MLYLSIQVLLKITDMLLRRGSKIEARFHTFNPHFPVKFRGKPEGWAKCLSQFYDFNLGPCAATPPFDVRSSSLFCGRPGGLEVVTRLLSRSDAFCWQFSSWPWKLFFSRSTSVHSALGASRLCAIQIYYWHWQWHWHADCRPLILTGRRSAARDIHIRGQLQVSWQDHL